MARPLDTRKATAILDASIGVFAERGYHGTAVSDIARVLGIGHGTVYRYFDNKLDVFGRVIDRAVETIVGAVVVEDPTAARTLDEYRAQIGRIGHRLFDLFTTDPRLARLLFIEAVGIDASISSRLDRARAALAVFTGRYLHNGLERGFLREDLDVEITAEILNGMILNAARAVLSADPPARDALRDRWIAAVQHLVFDGVGRPPSP